MSAELVAFLRARLDEEEREATDAAGDEQYQRWALNDASDLNEGYIVSTALRVLADVAAKRRIVELHAPRPDYVTEGGAEYGREIEVGQTCVIEDDVYPCDTLCLLALSYAGHDGWREEWRPT